MKKKHIILYVLGVVIVIIAAVGIWQRDTIYALYRAFTLNSEDIAASETKNNSEIQAELAEQGLITPVVTDDEVNAVVSGEKTTREVAEELLKKQLAEENKADNTDSGSDTHTLEQKSNSTTETQQTAQTQAPATATPSPAATEAMSTPAPTSTSTLAPTSTPTPTPTTTPAPKPEDYYEDNKVSDAVNYEINLRVTELYIVESLYYSKIGEVIEEAKTEYRQLPSDKRTKKNKIDIALSKAGEMTSLQNECDTQVYAIIDEIKHLLIDAGQSTSLSDNIKQYYDNKKADQTAYYLNKLST